MRDKVWTEEDIRKMMANPAYCLGNVIPEELWIKAAKQRIKEDGDGGENFLRDLLNHLRAAP